MYAFYRLSALQVSSHGNRRKLNQSSRDKLWLTKRLVPLQFCLNGQRWKPLQTPARRCGRSNLRVLTGQNPPLWFQTEPSGTTCGLGLFSRKNLPYPKKTVTPGFVHYHHQHRRSAGKRLFGCETTEASYIIFRHGTKVQISPSDHLMVLPCRCPK